MRWEPIHTAQPDGTLCALKFRDGLGSYEALGGPYFLHDDGHWYSIDPPLQVAMRPTHWYPLTKAEADDAARVTARGGGGGVLTTSDLVALLRTNDPAGTRVVVFRIEDEDSGEPVAHGDLTADAVRVALKSAQACLDGRDHDVLRLSLRLSCQV